MFIHPRIGHLEREILIISKTEILQYITIIYFIKKDRSRIPSNS